MKSFKNFCFHLQQQQSLPFFHFNKRQKYISKYYFFFQKISNGKCSSKFLFFLVVIVSSIRQQNEMFVCMTFDSLLHPGFTYDTNLSKQATFQLLKIKLFCSCLSWKQFSSFPQLWITTCTTHSTNILGHRLSFSPITSIVPYHPIPTDSLFSAAYHWKG